MSTRWPEVKFGEVMTPNRRPYTLGPTEDADLVGMRLYGGGPFHRELKPGIKIAKKSHFRIRAGDVIYNKLFAWKGTFGVVPQELDGMFVSDKFPTYELNSSLAYAGYLKWFFRHPEVWEQAQAMSTGSAALSKLTLNPPKFLELTMPLPPLAEQQRIVARIEELDAKTTEARRLQTLSAQATKALVVSAVSARLDGLSLKGTLGDVLLEKPRNGWSPKCDNTEAGTPVLALSAVTGFNYRCHAFKRTSEAAVDGAHYWLQPGDLLITRSNTPELVGHVAIYDGNPFPCIYPDLMMKLRPDPCSADARFVWMWLQTNWARDFILKKAKGTSPTMKKISQGAVNAIPFPSELSVLEQSSLVRKLDELRLRIDEVGRLQDDRCTKVTALLPAVLDRAFKGEL